eukprot:gb/GECG01016824.1/.p1 GENE.gb/GECG01016824.1/~~gb/GECG01016824.1/.p1  ORF type:complete len:1800 (+),score=238.82 gb/GECG01016824.1/:1-5400(+)
MGNAQIKSHEAYENGNYEEALKYIEYDIDKHGANASNLSDKGVYLIELDRRDEAMRFFDQALEQDPNHLESYQKKASCLVSLGREAEAEPVFEKTLELDPDNVEAMYGRAYCLMKRNDHENANRQLEQVLEKEPNNSGALNNRGYCLMQTGQLDESIKYFDQAINKNKKYTEAITNKGTALSWKGEHKKAIAEFDKAIKLSHGSNINAYLSKATSQMRLGKNEDALQTLEEARNSKNVKSASTVQILLRMTSCYSHLEDYEKAHKTVNQVFVLDQDNKEAFLRRGIIQYHEGKLKEALLDFEECRNSSGLAAHSESWIGRCNMKLRRYREALDSFEKAALLSDRFPCFYERGYVLLRLHQYNESIDQLNEALKDDSLENEGEVHCSLALAHNAIHEYDEAIRHAKESREFLKNTADPQIALALALNRQGKYEEALTAVDKALKNSANNICALSEKAYAVAGLKKEESPEAEKSVSFATEEYADDTELAYVFSNISFVKYQSGKPEEAVRAATRALQYQPDLDWAYFYRALASFHQGNHKDALQGFERAREMGLHTKESLTQEGICLYQIGEYEKSFTTLKSAVDENETCIDANHYIGLIHLRKEEFQQALDTFNRVLQADPNFDDSRLERGYVCVTLHRFREAISDFETVFDCHTTNVRLLENYGAALNAIENPEEALEKLGMVRKSGMEGASLSTQLYIAYFALGRFKEAFIEIQKVLERTPDDDLSLWRRGLALLELGRLNDAIDSFMEGLKLNSSNKGCYVGLGRCYNQLSEYTSARESLERALELGEDSAKCYFELGKTTYFARTFGEALVFLNKALERQSTGETWFFQGLALMQMYRHGEAASSFRKSIELTPSEPLTWVHLIHSLLKEREYSRVLRTVEDFEARFDLEQQLSPANCASIHRCKAVALYNLGEFARAKKHLDLTLSMNDSDAEALFVRGNCHSFEGDHRGALEDFKLAKELDQGYPCLFEQATELIFLRRYEKATEIMDVAINTDDRTGESYALRARAKNGLHHYESGSEFADEAIALLPQGSWGYYAKGYALNRQGAYNKALETLNGCRSQMALLKSERAFALAGLKDESAVSKSEEAIKEEKEPFILSQLYSNHAFVLFSFDRYDEAISAGTRSIELDSTIDTAYHYRGMCHIELGHPEEGYQDMIRAHKNGMPQTDDLSVLEGQALFNQTRYEEALEAFQRAIEYQEDNFKAQYYCGLICMKLCEFAKALDHFMKATKIDSNSVDAFVYLGFAQLHLGYTSEALESAHTSLKLDSSSRGYHLKACCLQSLGELQGAVKSFDHSLQLDNKQHEAWRKRGECYLQLGDVASAEGSLQNALELKSNDPNALSAMGDVLCEKDDLERAFQYYNKGIDSDGSHSKSYRGRGYCKMQNEHFEAALDDYLVAHELQESSPPRLHYYMAFCLNKLGRYHKAISLYQHYLRLEPWNFRACRDLTRCLHATSQYGSALKYHDHCIELKPEDYKSHLARAQCLLKLERYSEALESIEATLELRPALTSALRDKAECYNKMGRYEHCIATADAALKDTPENSTLWGLRANALFFLKLYTDAITSFDKALSFRPEFAEALSNKGACLNELEQFDDALECLEKAVRLRQDFAEAYSNLGNTLIGLHEYNEACATLDKSIALNDKNPNAYNNKGNALLNLKDYKAAIKNYDKALELNPNQPVVLTNKAFCLVELGWFIRVIEAADKALEIDPNYTEAYGIKGVGLNGIGKYEKAINCFNRVLKENPRSSQALVQKGYALFERSRYNDAIQYFDRAILVDPSLKKARDYRYTASLRL